MKRALLLLCLLPWVLSASSQEPVKVNVTKPGTLSTLLTQAQQDTCQYLIVSGKLNSADIKVLRKMAGASGHGSLHTLNLNDATIASSEEPYLTIRNAEEKIFPNVSSVKVNAESTGRMIGWSVFSPEPIPFSNLGNDLQSAKLILPNQEKQILEANAISQNLPLWKSVTKIKSKGHQIIEGKDGHYTYSAFTYKKHFCRDMFYNCLNLKQVIVPQKGKMCEDVFTLDQCRGFYDWLPMIEYQSDYVKDFNKQMIIRMSIDTIAKLLLGIIEQQYVGSALVGAGETDWAKYYDSPFREKLV